MFGTLADFEALVARAHELGLKVHDRPGAVAQLRPAPLVRREPRQPRQPEGRLVRLGRRQARRHPPNNWLSVFGGVAWQWDTRRKQYYLHNFLASQPDLNFHNPQVQDALLATRCVSGSSSASTASASTRSTSASTTRSCATTPAAGMPDGSDPTAPASNPYAWQVHQLRQEPAGGAGLPQARARAARRVPERHQRRRDRRRGRRGDGRAVHRAAATSCTWPTASTCCAQDCTARPPAPRDRQVRRRVAGDGWACWALSQPRLRAAWPPAGAAREPPPALLRLAIALQLSLRGTVLHLPGRRARPARGATCPSRLLQDPYGIAMWPDFKGRDGCRTPMPWEADGARPGLRQRHAASPGCRPPQPPRARRRPPGGRPGSLLHHYRHLLRWRRGQPALMHGSTGPVAGARPGAGLRARTRRPAAAVRVQPERRTRRACRCPPAWPWRRCSPTAAQRRPRRGKRRATSNPWGVLFARLA